MRLNRAVAVGKLRGPIEALGLLEPLMEDLRRYRPYQSVRAALLEESGDIAAAIEALEVALACELTRQESNYLTETIASLKKSLQRLSD